LLVDTYFVTASSFRIRGGVRKPCYRARQKIQLRRISVSQLIVLKRFGLWVYLRG